MKHENAVRVTDITGAFISQIRRSVQKETMHESSKISKLSRGGESFFCYLFLALVLCWSDQESLGKHIEIYTDSQCHSGSSRTGLPCFNDSELHPDMPPLKMASPS